MDYLQRILQLEQLEGRRSLTSARLAYCCQQLADWHLVSICFLLALFKTEWFCCASAWDSAYHADCLWCGAGFCLAMATLAKCIVDCNLFCRGGNGYILDNACFWELDCFPLCNQSDFCQYIFKQTSGDIGYCYIFAFIYPAYISKIQ